MGEVRKPASQVTPDYEDRGIFKSEVGTFKVALIPKFDRNSRNDLLVKGFLEGQTAIDVVFAGRRTRDVGVLVAEIRRLWTQATRSGQARGDCSEPEQVRCPVLVEGAWRPRFVQDAQGWQLHHHQLYAARWWLMDASGTPIGYGERVLPR